MALNIAKYATDSSKEENGVWQEWDDEVSFCIRRISSDKSQKAREEAEKPHKIKARNGTLSDDTNQEIAIYQLAYGVLADWKGLADVAEDGTVTEIPFSPAKALEILSDDQYKDVRNFILQTSLDRDLYKKEADKVALGN